MRVQHLLVCCCLIFTAFAAQAFERQFPSIAKRGTFSIVDYPTVRLNGQTRRLSVGAWIKNKENRIDLPGTLGSQQFIVNYTENFQGEIDRVWILNEQEVKKPAPGQPDRNHGISPETSHMVGG